MKKGKILSVIVAFVLVLLVCITVSAGADSDVIVSMQINNPVMQVNGISTEIDQGRGTTPVITGGRTLVPVRAIIEAFDGTVGWEESTRTVTLGKDGEKIQLVIDSKVARLNGAVHTLDVAPTVINGRTMLPIRFVAEGFNIAVAWNGRTQTVTLVQNGLDDNEYAYLTNTVPAYSGSPYVTVNNNVPFFEKYEIIDASFEYYSDTDSQGRCDVCFASVAEDIMPTGDRGSISSVTPTGWINKEYDSVPGGYIYNRCHLIGYQLTGENANERNLITGTRYLNIDGMLPFENAVDDYIEQTGNRVMYRVTPVFKNNNLVADGVLMEAWSVEDNGKGVSFCVYCYNVQPGINIDYATGNSNAVSDGKEMQNTAEPTTSIASGIYRTPTGKRYHLDPDCGGKNSYAVTYDDAIAAGLTPCKKCAE